VSAACGGTQRCAPSRRVPPARARCRRAAALRGACAPRMRAASRERSRERGQRDGAAAAASAALAAARAPHVTAAAAERAFGWPASLRREQAATEAMDRAWVRPAAPLRVLRRSRRRNFCGDVSQRAPRAAAACGR
jgi:hypothetical protein